MEDTASTVELLGPINIDPGTISPVVSLTLFGRWAALREAKVSAIRDAAGEMRRQTEAIQRSLDERFPLVQCGNEVQTAKDSLARDLDAFFRNVELYRDGVFSHQTKESISTLGIGAQLDALEREFTDNDKATFTAEATESLFPNFAANIAQALTHFSELDKSKTAIATLANDLKIPSPDISRQCLAPTIEQESISLLTALTSELQNSADHLRNRLQVRIAAAMVDLRRNYESEITRARRVRFARFMTIMFGAAVAAAGILLGYLYVRAEVPHDVFSLVSIEVVAGLMVGGISFFVAKAFDKFPKRSAKIRNEFQILFKRAVSEITETEVEAHGIATLNQGSLSDRLKKVYGSIVYSDPDNWDAVATERLAAVRDWHSKLSTVTSQYKQIVTQAVESIALYFSNSTKNLELLTEAADRIKARAIEPSFDLLASTNKSLEEVKRQIDKIEFS